jgi:hypothetical protein
MYVHTAKRFIGIFVHCKRTVCMYTLGTWGFAFYLASVEFIHLFVLRCEKKYFLNKNPLVKNFEILTTPECYMQIYAKLKINHCQFSPLLVSQ